MYNFNLDKSFKLGDVLTQIRYCNSLNSLFRLLFDSVHEIITIETSYAVIFHDNEFRKSYFYNITADNAVCTQEHLLYREDPFLNYLIEEPGEAKFLKKSDILNINVINSSIFTSIKEENIFYYKLISRNELIGLLIFNTNSSLAVFEARQKELHEKIRLFAVYADNLIIAQENVSFKKQVVSSELAVINDIIKKAISTLRIPELLDYLVSYLTRQTNFDRVLIVLQSKENAQEYEGIVATIENKQKYVISNLRINSIPDSVELTNILTRHESTRNVVDAATFIAFPLIVRGNLAGILGVDNYYKQAPLNRNEVNLLNAVVSQIDISIDNANLYEDMKLSALGFKQLFEVASSFNTILDYEQAAKVIVDKISASIAVSQGYLISFEIDNYCKVIAAVNEKSKYLNTEIELTKPFKQSIVSKRPVVYDHEKHLRAQCLDLKYALIVPLYIKNKLTGLLCLGETDETEKRNFFEHDIKLVQTIANQAAITLENAQLYNKLEDMVVERTVDLIDSNKALQKQKEELEIVSHRLQAIISSIPDGIVVINKDNHILRFNPAFEKILNYLNINFEQSNLMGVSLSKITDFIDNKSKNYHNINELFSFITDKKINEPRELDFVLENQDENHYYKVLTAPFRFSGDIAYDRRGIDYEKLGGQVIVFHDITKEKEIDKLKSDFTAVVSHELKTPVSAMMGFATIIEDGIAGEVNPAQMEYLNKIQGQGERLIRLINDLLDFSRLEAGQMPLYLQLLDSEEVIMEVVETLRPLVDEKNMSIETDIEPELPPITVDPDKLKQILINLISNAVKFTPENTGKIEVGVRLNKETSELLFSVRDNGIGIPEKDKEKLFDRFYQVDNSSTRKYGGTGLGLAIVKKLLELNRGRIYVESEMGKGSSFYFTLPVEEPDEL